jgi:hypothetical protein
MRGLRRLVVAVEAALDGELEGMEEESERRFEGERVGGGVGVVESEGGECVGLCVVVPKRDVGGSDACEVRVELYAFDVEEWELGGEEHGAAFAGTDVEEDGAFDVGRGFAR